MPEQTLRGFADHGQVARTLDADPTRPSGRSPRRDRRDRPRRRHRRARARGRAVVLRLLPPALGLHRGQARRRDRHQRVKRIPVPAGPDRGTRSDQLGRDPRMDNVALFFHLLGALLFVAGIVLAGAAFETARGRQRPAEIALLLGLTRIGGVLSRWAVCCCQSSGCGSCTSATSATAPAGWTPRSCFTSSRSSSAASAGSDPSRPATSRPGSPNGALLSRRAACAGRRPRLARGELRRAAGRARAPGADGLQAMTHNAGSDRVRVVDPARAGHGRAKANIQAVPAVDRDDRERERDDLLRGEVARELLEELIRCA